MVAGKRGRPKEEKYFIRTGPSTTKLSPSDTHKHISNNFEVSS